MPYDPKRHHRRSIRLPGYGYGQKGAYCVTICAQARECLFGQVVAGRVMLSDYGEIVRAEWLRSAAIRAELALDACVVMPNHIHGVVFITKRYSEDRDVGAYGRAPLREFRRSPKSLGSFVAGFKAAATKRVNALRGTTGEPVWQRNYYEHIIRDEAELSRVRQYIENNPARWELDPENPEVRATRQPPAVI